MGVNGGADVANEVFQFGQIVRLLNHKFELKMVMIDPLAKNFWLESVDLVSISPSLFDFSFVWLGVAKFGAKRGEIAGDALGGDGSCGFDGEMFFVFSESTGEEVDLFGDHRFATGENHVRGREAENLLKDFVDTHLCSLRAPRGVGRVAPSTAEIASGSSDKHRWNAGQFAFSLNGVEDFRNEHWSGFGWFTGEGRGACVGGGIF